MITILPQTDDYTLCLRFSGVVTKEEHYNSMSVPGLAIIERHGFYNLVIEYAPDYQGLTPEAADQRFRLIGDWGKYGAHVAYVNPSARLMFMTKLARILLGKADVRFFATSELDEAIAWARQGRPKG